MGKIEESVSFGELADKLSIINIKLYHAEERNDRDLVRNLNIQRNLIKDAIQEYLIKAISGEIKLFALEANKDYNLEK